MNIQAMIDRLNEQQIDPDTGIVPLMDALETIGIYYDDDQRTRWNYRPPAGANRCQCSTENYGYGAAVCFDCGKIKNINKPK